LIIDGELTGGQVLNVFFAIIIGAFSLGNAGPSFTAISCASGVATNVFETIERKSQIDASSPDGIMLDKVKGNITFKNVNFAYPTRKDVPILKAFSLDVNEGETVALVGSSGSGKSTIVKLLERFYDPVDGEIFLDGLEIKTINIATLRAQIGFVGYFKLFFLLCRQEPVLFSTSIRENIMYGLNTHQRTLEPTAIETLVEEACKAANAWDFISKLPSGLDTQVGESAGKISGGQKQRIAIARAIIRFDSSISNRLVIRASSSWMKRLLH
jgi:ABC-type multidrug transport system fused ATPase/permease subunit